jgi:hypothetical protein
MSTWNHEIITDNEERLSANLALKRFMLYLVLSVIGMSWIVFDKENRCLPDKILGLKIIKKRTAS